MSHVNWLEGVGRLLILFGLAGLTFVVYGALSRWRQ
jgi:hypothetical protein